eukprot:COSAG02_NODE_8388_length_2588_cov_5.222981_3_plen_47_part_01
MWGYCDRTCIILVCVKGLLRIPEGTGMYTERVWPPRRAARAAAGPRG